MSTQTRADNDTGLPPSRPARTGGRSTHRNARSVTTHGTSEPGASTKISTKLPTSCTQQRMTDGRVPTAVATPNVPNRASLPTVAYSGAWDAWLRSYGTWKEGLSEARCDEEICRPQVGGGDLRYPAGQDFPGSIVNDKFIPPLAFAREMHHRTPSSSTASSSSLKTEHNGDWWEENSPWAWQWADVESQKVGGKVTSQKPVVENA